MKLAQYDTLDDRREIHRLLQLVDPRIGVLWLKRQCDKCQHGTTKPGPSRRMAERVAEAVRRGGEWHFRLATEIYLDAWALAGQYQIDMGQAAKELEEMAKKKG